MKFITEEVQMVQHRFKTPIVGRITNVEKILNKFVKESLKKQKHSENLIWELKKYFDHIFKTQASSIKKLEVQLGKITGIVQNRETGSLPSSTKVNPRGLAHAITMRSGFNYKPPANPLEENDDSNNKQNIHKYGGTNDRDEVSQPVVQRRMVESYVSPVPFPSRLKK
nr:hypothetical protein [Tanacetum cinerariifolium]